MKQKYQKLDSKCLYSIKVPLDFKKHPPRPEKLIKKVLAFCRESELETIIVDSNMKLCDGYCSYLIALEVGHQFAKIAQFRGTKK